MRVAQNKRFYLMFFYTIFRKDVFTIFFVTNTLQFLMQKVQFPFLQEMFDLKKHDKTSGQSKEQKEVYESGDYR